MCGEFSADGRRFDVKLPVISVAFVLIAAPLILAQTRIPPGLRQADQVEDQTQKNIPPPITLQPHFDLVRLGQQADELARIAQTIPPDVASIQEGKLPKDIIEKLKQIEKLSKRLRSQIKP
jgi:hypothetical protein